MKVRNFDDYLKTRLDEDEIREIERAAEIEFTLLKDLKLDISHAVKDYMNEKKIGFNELARLLGKSPSQITKIMKGEANLTLASIAQILALIGKKVHIVD